MKLGILGAGAIGTYVGAKLALAGHEVVMVGRLGEEIATHGIELSDHAGGHARLESNRARYVTEPEALAGCEAVFVTVKSMATESAARPLASILTSRTTIVSLQNGVANPPVLRSVLPQHEVLAGMVPFNVARTGPGRFHNGTDGPLVIEAGGERSNALAAALREAGFEVETRADVVGVQWSKLLVNLNNAVNALSGIPLLAQLQQRSYRRVMGLCVSEGLVATKAAGIRLVRVGKMIPSLAPYVLPLPNFLFFAAARAMVAIDPKAKSSMLDDLERGRLTEVDYLNGEIVRLGEPHGVPTPVNRAVVELIRAAEAKHEGSPRIGAEALLQAVS